MLGHYQVIVCPFIRIRELEPDHSSELPNHKPEDVSGYSPEHEAVIHFLLFHCVLFSQEYSEIIPGQKIGRDGFIGGDYHISKYPLPPAQADPRVQR